MNKIYHSDHNEQMQVEVILASQPAGGKHKPIYTIRMRYPRIIHGEIMTHRLFSRNARSSRAVPVKTMLLECTSIPFIPWHWGKNQKGMQADKEHNAPVEYLSPKGMVWRSCSREDAWLHARDGAVETAEAFMNSDYHKQLANRLLEPFSWIDTLITSTDWGNFLWLRDHKDAEPHLQDLARLVKQAIEEAVIQPLDMDKWHLPYIADEDYDAAFDTFGSKVDEGYDWLLQISAARCARISYKPFNGDSSYKAEIDRYNQLVTSDRVHASPLEHQAKPDIKDTWAGDGSWASPQLHGNLEGYIQARKLVPNEVYSSN